MIFLPDTGFCCFTTNPMDEVNVVCVNLFFAFSSSASTLTFSGSMPEIGT